MSDKLVLVPSRGRPQNVARTLPRWIEQGYQIRYVVEARDVSAYEEAITQHLPDSRNGTFTNRLASIIILPKTDHGIGYARQECLRAADLLGVRTFVLSDDDVMPKPSYDFSRLHHAVTELGVLACSSVHDYQNFMSGGFLKEHAAMPNADGRHGSAFLAANGSWHTCYALNTRLAIELGGFNPNLNVAYEDNDLHIRGVLAGHAWLAHSGVWMDYIGKRFAPGGLADYAGIGPKQDTWYQTQYKKCHTILHEAYPQYVSSPSKRMLFQWSKINKTGLGDDWKTLSAMHDGHYPDSQYV